MAGNDRLLKKKQANFLISNFREFHKLWRDNQEAILKVKCCDGKLTINFESSFKGPEPKPTLPRQVNEKVKRISPSRRKRNLARAELFRRNKASKDTADGFPANSKESQEDMEISGASLAEDTADGFPAPSKESQEERQEALKVSEASHELASEKLPTSAVPVDKATSIPETSQGLVQHGQVLLKPPSEVAKRDTTTEDEKFNDAENWNSVSRVKSKQSELLRRIERFETEIRKDLAGIGPVKRGQSVTARVWVDRSISDLQKRISKADDANKFYALMNELLRVSAFIMEWKEGLEPGGQPNLFDELETKAISLQREAKRQHPGLMGAFETVMRNTPREDLAEMSQDQPRAMPAHKLVDSYKHSPSAKFRKKK